VRRLGEPRPPPVNERLQEYRGLRLYGGSLVDVIANDVA
jgi:hypothetical protein